VSEGARGERRKDFIGLEISRVRKKHHVRVPAWHKKEEFQERRQWKIADVCAQGAEDDGVVGDDIWVK